MKKVLLAAFATASIAMAVAPAEAAITLCNSGASCVTGTTNVNLNPFTNSPTVTGTVGIGGPLVTFVSTNGNLSTNPGAATVFVASGSLLTNLTFTILSGFTSAEFNLLNGRPSSFTVTLTDSAGDTYSQLLTGLTGSNIFNIIAPAGTVYTSGSLVSTSGGGFVDFKQLRVILATPRAVPEPATWAMMLLGFGGVGMTMRRRRRHASLMQIA